jgi:anti-sigma regulatory factor (Ser/Thr protein kinase)
MMEELSLNILDIAQNSISANASCVHIRIIEDNPKDELTIEIEDNGKGMSEELLAKVESPFITTRTTRKVGLGISFFKEAAEDAGGSFSIRSAVGEGTTVTARFQKSHIDRQPLGDIVGTVTALILLSPDVDFSLTYAVDQKRFDFSTREAKEMLGGEVKINSPEIIKFISDYLTEQINNLYGGV